MLKGTYGAGSCYFLPINSLDPTSSLKQGISEPWSDCLRITEMQVSLELLLLVSSLVMNREH